MVCPRWHNHKSSPVKWRCLFYLVFTSVAVNRRSVSPCRKHFVPVSYRHFHPLSHLEYLWSLQGEMHWNFFPGTLFCPWFWFRSITTSSVQTSVYTLWCRYISNSLGIDALYIQHQAQIPFFFFLLHHLDQGQQPMSCRLDLVHKYTESILWQLRESGAHSGTAAVGVTIGSYGVYWYALKAWGGHANWKHLECYLYQHPHTDKWWQGTLN